MDKKYLIKNIKIKSNDKNYKNTHLNQKKRCILIITQQILIILLILLIIYKKVNIENNNLSLLNLFRAFKEKNNNELKKELDYENYTFAIIKKECKTCGLFAFHNHYLGCMITYLQRGFIPVIDLKSFPNIFNRFNASSSTKNYWELFFNQPFGYKLSDIEKKAKNIIYFECNNYKKPNKYNIYINKVLMDFWHNLAYKYISIKKEIIKEAESKRDNLFKGSNNVLGVLMRGTDYIAKMPKNHCIPPNIAIAFKDIKLFNNKNKYDFIFLATEDDIIRNKFIKEFGQKLKYLKPELNIEYNFEKKRNLAFNKNIIGNHNFMKMYLINIIILSKCIDIICARTGGSIGAFVLTKGFRNTKVYYLGEYK